MKPRKWFTRFRSARSGRYVSRVEAETNPDTTVGEKKLTTFGEDSGGVRHGPGRVVGEQLGEGPEDAHGV